jgi:phosphatidylserine synthase
MSVPIPGDQSASPETPEARLRRAGDDVQGGESARGDTPSRAIPRGARQMFGVKDLFTSVNALSGVFAIYFCIKGHPLWASYSFLVGYAADCVDGLVARATKSGNRFGAEFDTAADFVAQAVAPAFVVFTLYAQSAGRLGVSAAAAEVVGLFLASALVLAATIRQARNTVRPVAVDFAWVGLPRNVASFILLGFTNSVFFSRLPGGLWLGIPLVLLVAVGELSNLPFMSHHGRKQFWYSKMFLIGFLVTTPLSVFFLPRYAWDVIFFWTAGYAAGSWTVMTPEERREIREAVVVAKEKLVREETARIREKEALRIRQKEAAR